MTHHHPATRHGTLVLISDSLEQITSLEGIDPDWNTISVLLGPVPPVGLVSLLAFGRNAVVAALTPEASAFVLGLPGETIRRLSGIYLAGPAEGVLSGFTHSFDRDMAYMAPCRPSAAAMRLLRSRFTNLRFIEAEGEKALRDGVRAMLERIHERPAVDARIRWLAFR